MVINMDEDTLLQIFEGSPIEIYNSSEPFNYICSVYPVTIRQTVKIKYSKYNLLLMNLVARPEDFGLPIENINGITTYEIIVSNILYGDNIYRLMIIEALEFFLHENIIFSPDLNVFYIGDISENRIIDKNIFEKIVQILKIQNCVRNGVVDDEFKNCANSKAEEIKRKILKGRQSIIVNKDMPTFKDLISVLAANGNNLNILNIWDLTIYSFNDQFSRMQMIEEYNLNFRSLLAGASSEEIKLKHYIRAIES